MMWRPSPEYGDRMSGRLPKLVGGPVGRFRFDVFDLPVRSGSAPEGPRLLQAADLAAAASAGLTAPNPRSLERLAEGDIALGVDGPDGSLAGLVWLGLETHYDSFAGRWARPTADVGYLNQLFVASSSRGQGLGRLLIRSCQHAAADAGRTHILALVKPDNLVSRAAFEAEGARCTHRLYGVRLGRPTLRIAVPVRS